MLDRLRDANPDSSNEKRTIVRSRSGDASDPISVVTSPARALRGNLRSIAAAFTVAVAVCVLPLAGCGGRKAERRDTVDVGGRSISLPAPAGMNLRSNPDIREPGRRCLARFDADSSVRRWIALKRTAEMPCFATVSIETGTGNAGDGAAGVLERHRAQPAVGTRDSAAIGAWHDALARARSGARGPLPSMPGQMVRIERIDTRPDACLDLIYSSSAHDLLIGTALVVVRGRALWLEVYQYSPTDLGELARVRSILVQWVDGVRKANA